MKKITNIQTLKAMVNASALERVECKMYGVQAYNLVEGEEYTVIVAYIKQGNRYYFVDREGRKFLASRYNRAEEVAAEILDRVAAAEQYAYERANELQEKGETSVNIELLPEFFAACDYIGITPVQVAAHFHDNGDGYNVYRLAADDNGNDTEQDNTDNGNDNEQDTDNEQPTITATAKAAKVARTVARRTAFVASMVGAAAIAFITFGALCFATSHAFDALNINGTVYSAILGTVALFTVILDLTAFVELNTLTVISRLFPDYLDNAQGNEFTTPRSYVGMLFAEIRRERQERRNIYANR